jgi:uncharacterized coiled-coil protein SlyX
LTAEERARIASLVDVEARVTQLEIALSHQDRLVEKLNQVLVEQQATIARLEAEMDRLKEQVAQILQAEPLENAPPPHH